MSAQTIILQYACPIIGIIIAQVMFAAPLQSVRECVKKGSLGVLNPAPWAIMTANCVGWVGYSYLTKNIFVLVGNFPGVVISIWLNMCAIKLQYHDHTASIMRKSMASFLTSTRESIRSSTIHHGSLKLEDLESIETAVAAEDTTPNMPPSLFDSRMADLSAFVLGLTATENVKAPAPQEKILITMSTFWLFIFSLVSFIHISNDKKILIVGIVANINNLFFYAAPLSTMVTVFRTKSSISIHRRTMIMNTANGAFWAAYGLAVNDVFLIIPNSIGTILGVVQIVLCMIFPAKAALGGEELLDKSIVTSSYGTDEEDRRSSQTSEVVNTTQTLDSSNGVNHTAHDNRKSTVRFSLEKNDLALHDEASSTTHLSILKHPKSAVRFSVDSNKEELETRDMN
jgi:solute carrier family 50 protein (sugar transporter)